MKKILCLFLSIMVVFLAITSFVYARDRGSYGKGYYRSGKGYYHVGRDYHRGSTWRSSIWIGTGWGGWGPWWGPAYYPYRYPYYYPYYPEPPVVIQQQPPVYIQPEEQYWYFCQNPEGYYPYIKTCPGGWLKVVPSTPPDEKE